MNKQVPTLGKLLVMVGFALSCFGILLFLWISFGGPIPFQAKGYRFSVTFPETIQLAREADVRIAGVPVGKVKQIGPGDKGALVTIELDDRYAPRPLNTRAILRQKTLLGETYVELTPGSDSAPPLEDGGTLTRHQVASSVQLDEVLRALDPKTRDALAIWLQAQAVALNGRGQDLSDAIGTLVPFSEDTNELLEILNGQQAAVRRLVSDTGVVMAALNERDGQLTELVASANTVFNVTGDNSEQLAATFVALPTFERETRKTLVRLQRFLERTDPLIDQLRPVARQLEPTLAATEELAPQLKALFANLDELIDVSERGLPALRAILTNVQPLLAQLNPTLTNLNPMLEFVGPYRREITAFFANTAAATQASDISGSSKSRSHYLRVTTPLGVDQLSAYPNRLPTNRSNPYQFPNAFKLLAEGLLSYETRRCGVGQIPTLDESPNPYITQQLADLIKQYIIEPGSQAPRCVQQPKFEFGGKTTEFPQVTADP